jgi:hypothetical protein
MNRLSIAFTLLMAAAVGCTETVRVQTTPPGAKLFVNNREIGVTPVEFDAPSKDMPAARFRTEWSLLAIEQQREPSLAVSQSVA